MKKLTVRDVAVAGKRVFVRVDFNVPFDEKTGAITDDSRIRAALPTIKYLIDSKARIILCSHLGRPDGKVVESMRLTPVVKRLSQLLGQPVSTTADCIGPDVRKAVVSLREGQVLLLENVRFHPDEEKGNPAFARALASLADIFVNDAFGASHRAHASISGIADFIPSVAGFLLEREIDMLGGLLEDPERPFAALVGGAKVSDKVAVLENIIEKIDFLLVGGGMAATFLKAESYDVGQSKVEDDLVETAARLMTTAREQGVRLMLPVDAIVAEEIGPGARAEVASLGKILPQHRIVDIGPETVQNFAAVLRECRTVFWNGPMGIFELPQFAAGTRAMANELADLKATTIIGGGSTAEIVTNMELTEKMTFVSTGGGASLQFLGGEKLPGVEALLDKDSREARRLVR
ncbi:MAG: phosphoglycerate kinase [Chloroflexi bacterium]|nr:phosphoglycerate kinase [Chloroflexota bacterium]